MTPITLRPLTASDRDRIIEIGHALTLPGLQEPDDAQGYLDTVLTRSGGRAWMAVDEQGAAQGTVYLRDTPSPDVARCSTLFGEQGWESGTAAAAIAAVGEAAPGLSAVELHVSARNIRVLNHCQRAGMVRVAVVSDPDMGGSMHIYRLSL